VSESCTQLLGQSKHDSAVSVEQPFATKLIPLDNGIDQPRYEAMPVLSPPPLPRIPPPATPPPPAAAPQAESMQGMLRESFKFLSEELGNTFSDTLGRLNNSILKGMDGLREHMTSVTSYPSHDEEYDEEYREHGEEGMEEGELRDQDPCEQGEHEQPETFEPVNSLTILAATLSKDEGFGPKVDQKLADNVQALMRSKPDEKVISELFAKIKQPENCNALSQVVVNPSIWDKLSQEGRNMDAKLQKVQLALIKGSTEVTRMYDVLLTMARNGNEDARTALEHGNHALLSLGIANVDLVQRRREAMKPNFDTEYSHLFHHNTPFTSSLFGDDLSKHIKEITEDNKLLNNVVKTSKPSQRGKPYTYTRGQAFRGRSSYPRARGGNRSRQGFSQDRPHTYKRPYPSREVRHNTRRGTGGRRN